MQICWLASCYNLQISQDCLQQRCRIHIEICKHTCTFLSSSLCYAACLMATWGML